MLASQNNGIRVSASSQMFIRFGEKGVGTDYVNTLYIVLPEILSLKYAYNTKFFFLNHKKLKDNICLHILYTFNSDGVRQSEARDKWSWLRPFREHNRIIHLCRRVAEAPLKLVLPLRRHCFQYTLRCNTIPKINFNIQPFPCEIAPWKLAFSIPTITFGYHFEQFSYVLGFSYRGLKLSSRR